MNVRWEEVFQLPEATLAGNRRVPKTTLAAQALLTKHEQRTLDKMRRLELFATVTKGTTRIPPRVDDERDVQSVIFLSCEMAPGSQAAAEVAQLLHKCFPNPTVIMQDVGDAMCVSVSLMRKSLAERGATVVEQVASSGIFDGNAPECGPFLGALAFQALPQGDLQEYVGALAGRVMLARAIGALGFYPQAGESDQERLMELVARFDAEQGGVRRLYEERSGPDVTLNESAKLRIRIKKAERQRDATLGEIKELCNSRAKDFVI